MAKKGQKFNKYSKEFKHMIVSKYQNNLGTINSLSKENNLNISTLCNWISDTNKGIDITKTKHHLKGRKKEENIDYKERYEILKNYQTFLKAQREKK